MSDLYGEFGSCETHHAAGTTHYHPLRGRAAPPVRDIAALRAAIRRVWESGHPDLRSGLTTDPPDATLAAAILRELDR